MPSDVGGDRRPPVPAVHGDVRRLCVRSKRLSYFHLSIEMALANTRTFLFRPAPEVVAAVAAGVRLGHRYREPGPPPWPAAVGRVTLPPPWPAPTVVAPAAPAAPPAPPAPVPAGANGGSNPAGGTASGQSRDDSSDLLVGISEWLDAGGAFQQQGSSSGGDDGGAGAGGSAVGYVLSFLYPL